MTDARAAGTVAGTVAGAVDHAKRARRAWRIALLAFLVPMTVGTHWPRLGFGGGGVIDKFVHFIAFGTLGWIWMNARPRESALLGFLFALAWVYIDERTQALEILGRTFSVHDMAAGWLGIAMAGALFAIRRGATPAGSAARDDWELAQDMGYGEGPSWLRAGLITLATIVLVGALFVLKAWFSSGEVAPGTFVYAVGFSGVIGVAIAAFGVELFGRARARAARAGKFVAVPREAMPAWRAGFGIAAIVLLLLGYEALLLAMFGREAPEALKTDQEGFFVLRQGFLFAAVLVGVAASNAIGARAAFRANPRLAERR